jgi:hypothetical protein
MAKEEDEIVAIIPTGMYVEELEVQVKAITEDILRKGVPRVTKKYKHIEIPDFGKDKKARISWEMEEIRRCIHGYNDMPGKYYYYFNHCRIKHKSRGKIRPDFRTMDLEWFKFLEKIQKTKGKGIVCIKRRQVGMSWKSAADVIHDAQFNRDFDIGMNSKGIADSQQLLSKVRTVYRNQSDFLRVATSTDRRDAMLFAVYDKDEYGNRGKLVKGTESSIVVVAPTPVGHSGNQYLKLVLDEAGETEELEDIWANAEDCIMQDGVRVGTAVIFGTMGSSDKAGKGLMEFWKNHKMYDLERFPFWGYNELIMDELGNDDIENSVRWILYNRKKKEKGSSKVYNKFIQKYPLNEEDAFLSTMACGVGNPLTINKQLNNLADNPPEAPIGRMKMIGDEPHFEPNPAGHCVMREAPQKLKDGYTATLDPAEDDDVTKSKDSSDLGFSIMARPLGLLPPRIAFEYCHRPLKLEEAYLQIALACKMYGVKLHIELNKGGWRAYDWFSLYYPELLALPPKTANNLRSGVELKHGVKMNKDRKLQMEGLLNQHLDNYCLPDPSKEWKGIQSKRFLEQCKVFGGKGKDDDLAVSVGWNLIIQQGDKKVATHQSDIVQQPVSHRYEKTLMGTIKLVTNTRQANTRNIPRSIFG